MQSSNNYSSIFLRFQISFPNIVFLSGFFFLIIFLFLPHNDNVYMATYSNSLRIAADTLRGQIPVSDLAQDVIGARAIISRDNAYPILESAAPKIGVSWSAHHASTHPPTIFLYVLPISFLPWSILSAIWAWLMLVLIAASLHLYGLSWRLSIGFTPFLLLWPPVALGLGQFVVPWMFFLALAFKFRDRPLWAGIAIGLATMLKYLPVLLLLPFLIQRKFRTLLGFLTPIIIFISILFTLDPDIFSQYLDTSSTANSYNIMRCDNASLFISSIRSMGIIGLGVCIFFFLLLLFLFLEKFKFSGFSEAPGWMMLNYFAVSFLPLLWSYSLVPLIPIIGWLLSQKRPMIVACVILGVFITSIHPMDSCYSAFFTAFGTILFGLPFLMVVYKKNNDNQH